MCGMLNLHLFPWGILSFPMNLYLVAIVMCEISRDLFWHTTFKISKRSQDAKRALAVPYMRLAISRPRGGYNCEQSKAFVQGVNFIQLCTKIQRCFTHKKYCMLALGERILGPKVLKHYLDILAVEICKCMFMVVKQNLMFYVWLKT